MDTSHLMDIKGIVRFYSMREKRVSWHHSLVMLIYHKEWAKFDMKSTGIIHQRQYCLKSMNWSTTAVRRSSRENGY